MHSFAFGHRFAFGPTAKHARDPYYLWMNAFRELCLTLHLPSYGLHPDLIPVFDPFALGRVGVDEDLVSIRMVFSEII